MKQIGLLLLILFCMQVQGLAQSHPIINEIMMNPNNGALPQHEWVELYNPSDAPIRLGMYNFTYNDRHFPLPDVYLPARQYLILTAIDYEEEFSPFGNVYSMGGWPVLSNTGATIGIFHQVYGKVDEVTYSNRWYTSTQKRNGGWSLERINPGFSCNMPANWAESEALQGGTPGQRNSILNRSYVPELKIVASSIQGNRICLMFNMDVSVSVDFEGITCDPYIGELLAWSTNLDTLFITWQESVVPDNVYRFDVEGKLCGNDFSAGHVFFNGLEAAYNDVVINEVLFNPKEGGVDFVEIYNKSDKIINLRQWQLGNRNLSSDLLLFRPKTYFVITTDPKIIQQHYPSAVLDQVIVLQSLPAYANQQGIVTLFDPNMLIDSLYYQSSMHQPFISNPRGVSLERQSADMETNEFGNFTSAATHTEGATPGYENSKQREGSVGKNRFFLQSKTFSPDGDHVEDNLIIDYVFDQQNIMLNLYIYDDSGRLVNRLIRNQSLGSSGSITWDGRGENGDEIPSGTYLYLAEVYNDMGYSKVFKESFVLLRRGQGY